MCESKLNFQVVVREDTTLAARATKAVSMAGKISQGDGKGGRSRLLMSMQGRNRFPLDFVRGVSCSQ